MARFGKTLENLQQIAGHLPAALAAASLTSAPQESAVKMEDLERALLSLFQREDSVPIRISLLIRKLAAKYDGRAA